MDNRRILPVDDILHAKQERLIQRRQKTPPAAVIRLAEMQQPPPPLLNVVTGGETVCLLGQVAHRKRYDPVGQALRHLRAGMDGIAFFTDHQVYASGLDDLLLVCRGVRRPVLYQNYILDEYHVAEARASGAAALTLYASILPPDMLRRTVSITQRWRMAAVVQVESAPQLEYACALSPHALSIGSPGMVDVPHSLALLADLRHLIPRHTQVFLLNSLREPGEIDRALELGVDALVLDESLLDAPEALAEVMGLVVNRNAHAQRLVGD